MSPSSTSDAGAPTEPDAAPASVTIAMSPVAHVAVGLFTVALLSVVLAGPPAFAALLLVPVALSAAIVRYRTTATVTELTARTLWRSRTVAWDQVAGLYFGRGAWAQARLRDGSSLRLPAVTFATLPRLTAVTGGRVPNPYG